MKKFAGVWSVLGLFLMLFPISARAFELLPRKVGDNAWALVGEIAGRTAENHGLNNTLGFIVTPKGVVLIGSGATPEGARLIERTIGGVTSAPIRWVINIGAQDHHWLGNSYFADKGIEIIALERTVKAQKRHVAEHLERLKRTIGKEADTIRPVYATRVIAKDRADLDLGGVHIQLIWPGNGHFAGDALAWLPEQRIVYAGDFVFNDRMLGVHPFSQVVEWRKAFERMAALKPRVVVPGHGFPGGLAKARRDTGDYLEFLVQQVGKALDDWKDLGETIDLLDDVSRFRHLKFYDGWHRRNINRTYLQLEAAR